MVSVFEKFERNILHGLACEWSLTKMSLSLRHRHGLRIPLFSIKDMKSQWGSWIREKREIVLSRNLIFEHSWDSVKEVLLHEMAHQYADELLNGAFEIPHGPSFKRACVLLRANPKASGNITPLDHRVNAFESENDDKIIRQIKKLLSLASSQNRYEAESAMAKAHNLILKHNIELLERGGEKDFESIFLGKPALRYTKTAYMLAHILQDFYFVKCIWVPAFVLEKGKMGRVLEISGTMQNIQTASYVYDFIKNFIEAKWAGYNKNKGLNFYRKVDFAIGIIQGFRSKLLNQAKTNKENDRQWAIIKVEDPKLDAYFKYRYPLTRKFSRTSGYQDKRVLEDGKAIGKKLVIFKGVSQKGSGGIPLIGV